MKKETASTAFSGYDFLEMFVITMCALLLVFSFLFRQTVVKGGSMNETLADGERLLISDVFYTPKPGDIIVFQALDTQHTYPLVKRVIAVEGQTVAVFSDGIYVDGVRLSEEYVYFSSPSYSYQSFGEITPGVTYTVPENQLFVLGDHRDDSLDSRYFGFIDERTVLGRVILRIAPLSKFGTVK